jgi:hypothetical protein
MAGRKPLPDDLRRDFRITITFTASEREAYDRVKAAGKFPTDAEWVKSLVDAEVARQQKNRKRKADQT